jgi:two-component system sensor histidine kinase BaeS
MRLRLFLSYTLIVVVSVASFAILARQGAASDVRTFMPRGGFVGLENLVGALEDYYGAHQTWQGAEQVLESAAPGRGRGSSGMGPGPGGMMGPHFVLADAQGKVLIDTSETPINGRLSQNELDYALPLATDQEIVGYLLPEGGLALSQTDQSRLISSLNNTALTAGLIAGAASLFLALFLAYRLLRPVRALTSAAERLAAGDLSQRVEVRGDDELAALGRTFNRMAASLQQSEQSRRAMTADIAHELRNPLAVQRANLEALQDGIYPLAAENLAPILEQNHLLSRLVEDLRTLALADSGQLELVRTPTDLPALIQRMVGRFEPQASANQIDLQVMAPQACSPIDVDPGRVEQILGNLLSNAIRHTPAGGGIELRLICTPAEIRLSVWDSGPGIPEQALPNVFERFYRADKARSRAEGGTGLGLAIARQLARAHGGTLEAANHPHGGAVLTLSIPYESRRS